MIDILACRFERVDGYRLCRTIADSSWGQTHVVTVYSALDRLFSCKTHGWANHQAFALELPFSGDEQFARLHAAVRFLLPIVPGLAASSPIVDGERNGVSDNRLAAYRGKCGRLPAAIGAG